MATFDDLILECQPSYWAIANDEVTAGATWHFDHVDYGLHPDGTDPFVWTGVTGACRITDRITGSVVGTMTVTFTDDGDFHLHRAAGTTPAIPPGLYGWDLTFTSPSGKAVIWGGPNATLRVLPSIA